MNAKIRSYAVLITLLVRVLVFDRFISFSVFVYIQFKKLFLFSILFMHTTYK